MNSTSPTPTALRGDATREALIGAAMAIFARDGFDAASTRAIAEQAGINQALIGYHFGGKEGLYLAVFDHISAHVQLRISPIVQEMGGLLATAPAATTTAARRKRWLPPILALVDATLSMLLSPETEYWAQLMLREQARPTAAFDNIYNSFMGQTLELLTELAMKLRSETDRTAARLQVIGILGQVIVWRAARATTLRLLDWKAIDAREIDKIKQAMRQSITAQLLA